MRLKTKILAGLIASILIAGALFILLPRSVTISINGEQQIIRTQAWTVAQVLEQGDLTLQPEDQITPALNENMLGVKTIQIELARPVIIQTLPVAQTLKLTTPERNLGSIFALAGLTIAPQDKVLVNAKQVKSGATLPYVGAYFITLKQAVTLTIQDQKQTLSIASSADTVAEALDEANIHLASADEVIPPASTPLDHPISITIRRAVPITVKLKEKTISLQSAATNVGEALVDAGLSLQGLDYSIPAASEPIPKDGTIQLVRVREEVNITQTVLPFSIEYIKSDQVELDKTDIVKKGEFGLEVTRSRIRYEDDQETLRTEETTWIAKQPQTQQIGRGTEVVIRKMDTPQGEIEYWRTVNVYATSYSPCRSGTDRCYYGTSSGLPVQHGVIGVTRSWYNLMVGQRVYVPNYGIGTIADVGGGIAGKYWIDLGYSDSDYVAWYSNVTIYLLTPVPNNIPWILP